MPDAVTAGGEILAGLVIYFVAVLAIGIWTSRQVRGLDDFLLAGRRLGPWVTAISERASGESSWFLMGLPAAAYASGFREYWSVIGIAFGIFASWVLIALPLRRESESHGALTLPEYFAARFPRFARPIRVLAAAAIIVFYIAYLSAQLRGAGLIFQSVLGWESATAGMLLGAGVVVGYTLLGGFLAVAWTDLLQGLLMMVVSVALPLVVLADLGWSSVFDALQAARPAEFFAMGSFALDRAVSGFGFGMIVGGLAWGLGYLGQPHLLTRYMAIRSPREVRRATAIAVGWVLLAYWGVVICGVMAVATLGGDLAADRQELVLVELARKLLPGWVAGIVVAGILAAIMSTADSQLLVATSSVVEDVIVRLFGVRLSASAVVLLSRAVTVAVTVLALVPILSKQGGQLIYGIVEYAWSGLGSTFGPPLILALWWRRTSGAGVLAGMGTGIAATIIWKNVAALAALFDLKAATFAFSALAVVIASLALPPRGAAGAEGAAGGGGAPGS